MLQLSASAQLKSDLRNLEGRHWNMNLFKEAVRCIAQSDTTPIPEKYNDHALPGVRQGYRMMELGSLSSWVLLYTTDGAKAFIVRTGAQDEIDQDA